jgi:hypothetical protein
MAIQQGGGKARRDIEARFVARAWQDEAFKQELLRDPKAVVERELGITIPAGVNIRLHEETPTELHFVLPLDPARAGVELSDAELDAVAGGKQCSCAGSDQPDNATAGVRG